MNGFTATSAVPVRAESRPAPRDSRLPGGHSAPQPTRSTPPGTIGVALDSDDWVNRGFLRFGSLLAKYHRHRVEHLERLAPILGSGRRVIIVANHALNIIDPLMLVRAILVRYGVIPRFIGHPAWFRMPGVREIVRRYRVIPARSMDDAADALDRDGMLMLFPGAAREAAVRDYWNDPYKLQWEDRRGFLRLALDYDAEIVFVATVGNDELYYQSQLPIPDKLLGYLNGGDASRYRGARMTFGMLGLHMMPGVFPLPVQLSHVVSEPLDLGDRELARRDPRVFDALHREVWSQCQHLLYRAVLSRDEHSDATDRGVRAAQKLLHSLER